MSDIKLTKAQHAAVYTRGVPVLVSAAAGSGKTRVLVERLMSYICSGDRPCNITDFLIITFTRAAAAELRSRIFRELTRRIAADPENSHLRRQQILCHKANIGTIHSFCAQLLREHAHKLGLPLNFNIIDEERASELQTLILGRVLDRAYAGAEPGFLQLADTVGAGRSDTRLESVLLDLHHKTQCHAYPQRWLQEQISALNADRDGEISHTVWGELIIARTRRHAGYWAERMSHALSELEEQGAIQKAYGESLKSTLSALTQLIDAAGQGWDAIRTCLPIPFPRLKPLRNSPDAELSERIKNMRDYCKGAMNSIAAEFDRSSAELLAEMEHVRPAAAALLELAADFADSYMAEKQRLGFLDYSDLEHYALRLLVEPPSNDTGTVTGLPSDTVSDADTGGGTAPGRITDIAGQLHFREVLVDEYQDVSRVQDTIFDAVSGGRRLFMVGDVKQSIYRFRLADPGIFLEKYRRFSDLDRAGTTLPRRISLQENFRSRSQVLEAANHVFSNIMSTTLGELDYDEQARLRPAAAFPELDCTVELDIIEAPDKTTDEDIGKTELEAAHIARRIQRLISTETEVTLDGRTRPLEYSDIAILLRAPTASAAVYRQVLTDYGIPLATEQGGGFFESSEVTAAISMLALIDNPDQDIPLLAVLHSSMFDFTPDELAQIRGANPRTSLYSALRKSSDNSRCSSFLNTLDAFRQRAPDTHISTLLWDIYTQTGLLTAISTAADGDTRRLRLMLLFELARKFEQGGYRGLHSFISHLEHMGENGREPSITGVSTANAVQIMSIHKSKGLEYPVVFLAGTAGQFNTLDTKATVLIHPQLGLGMKLTDLERGIEYPTLPRRAIARRIAVDALSEEMRILYVAMTRARERLYISCVWKNPDSAIVKLRETMAAPLSPVVLEAARSPSHWLVQAALLPSGAHHISLKLYRHGGKIDTLTCPAQADISSSAEVSVSDTAAAMDDMTPLRQAAPSDGTAASLATAAPLSPSAPSTIQTVQSSAAVASPAISSAEIARRLSFVYPHTAAAVLPSKLTATELKGRAADRELREDAAVLPTRHLSPVFRIPQFASESTALTGAARGTAVHTVMQYIDFAAASEPGGIVGELERLAADGHITHQQFEAVDPAIIEDFFTSELGQRILRSEQVYREFRFSLLCDAADFFDNAGTEQLLLQGVVDCCFEEDGELIVVDFKTDFITPKTIPERSDEYAFQLRAYATAISRIHRMAVREAIIYYLHCSKAVTIQLSV